MVCFHSIRCDVMADVSSVILSPEQTNDKQTDKQSALTKI